MKTKNIIIFLISLVLITSCGTKEVSKKDQKIKDINVIGILKSGDPSKCNELGDEAKIKNCINNVYLDQAITKRDPEICKSINIEESKNRCISQVYFEQATEKEDEKICANINEKSIRNNCEDNVLFNKAIGLKNPELCETFHGEKNVCRDEIFFVLARDDKEKKFCKKIKNSSKKLSCDLLFNDNNMPNSISGTQMTSTGK